MPCNDVVKATVLRLRPRCHPSSQGHLYTLLFILGNKVCFYAVVSVVENSGIYELEGLETVLLQIENWGFFFVNSFLTLYLHLWHSTWVFSLPHLRGAGVRCEWL